MIEQMTHKELMDTLQYAEDQLIKWHKLNNSLWNSNNETHRNYNYWKEKSEQLRKLLDDKLFVQLPAPNPMRFTSDTSTQVLPDK